MSLGVEVRVGVVPPMADKLNLGDWGVLFIFRSVVVSTNHVV